MNQTIKWVSTKDKHIQEMKDIKRKTKMEDNQFNSLKRESRVPSTPKFKEHNKYISTLTKHELIDSFVLFYNLLTPWQGRKQQFEEYFKKFNIQISEDDET